MTHLPGLEPPPTNPALTEQQLQDAVLDLAKLLGWRRAHFRPAQTKHGWRTPVAGDGKGFPDLVLIRDRVLFVELKAEKGTLTDDQLEWQAAIETAGADWRVWRPHDWWSGQIDAVLRHDTRH